MKKVLILTCSTGEGHNSAARAIETVLKKKGIFCEVADPVAFQSQRMEKVVSGLYNTTIKKSPAVFGAVYKLGDLYCSARLPSPVYWANAKYSGALKDYIVENHFTEVICTHLYGMEAMTALRKRDHFEVPCYGVLTDYTCIPFVEETNLTGFFVPSQETRDYLVRKGIPRGKIRITGIPVDDSFRERPDRETARKELGIGPDRKVFLVMTGGVGCENMEGLCTRLLEFLRPEGLLLVMTGKNEELRARLEARQNPQLRVIPFTRKVPTYMAACDVLLSKPGGLSSTEAAVANVPLVHIHAIPGCETWNARFFADHGMSFCAGNDREAVSYANTLVYDPTVVEEMLEMQRKYINPMAAQTIVEKVMET